MNLHWSPNLQLGNLKQIREESPVSGADVVLGSIKWADILDKKFCANSTGCVAGGNCCGGGGAGYWRGCSALLPTCCWYCPTSCVAVIMAGYMNPGGGPGGCMGTMLASGVAAAR